MRPPRFRLRTLMIAVAVVGLAIGAYLELRSLRRAARLYSGRATIHATAAAGYRKLARSAEGTMRECEKMADDEAATARRLDRMNWHPKEERKLAEMCRDSEKRVRADAAGWRRKAAGYDAIADHYDRLTQKYKRATRYPWLSVAPDPPEPVMTE